MSKEKKEIKKVEEKSIQSQGITLPIALVIVAIVVAVILVTGGEGSGGSNDDNESEIEGATSADFGDYSDYITDGAVTTIDDDPYLGDIDTAKIAIVEFSEYLCYYCYRHTVEVMPDLISTYVDTGEVIYVFRDFQMYGEVSEERAQIGMCVDEVAGAEKFAEYHEKMKRVYSEDEEENPDIYAIIDDLGVDSDTG